MPESEPRDERDRRALPGYSDAELVERLRAAGCRGRLWDLASAELADRGVRTIHRMIATGSLTSAVNALLREAQPGRHFELRRSEAANATGWVGEPVARALHRFRRETMAGRGWSAEQRPGQQNAALATWVVNSMLLLIPDVLRTERTRAERHEGEVPCPPEELRELSRDRSAPPRRGRRPPRRRTAARSRRRAATRR